MKKLFWYHVLLATVYYLYAQTSASDSTGYFERSATLYTSWMEAYGTGTTFIDFLAYPFTAVIGFSYPMIMLLFAWIGYWSFIFFYIVFIENTRFRHTWKGADLVTIFLFLPNMHYWTASLGKGAPILLGLAITMFGLSKLHSRKTALLIGLLIIYHVRPHVFFLACLGILAGLLTARERTPLYQKLLVLLAVGGAVYFLYNDIIAFAQLDSDNLMNSFDELSSHRSFELAKSNSGIDISNYSLPLKLFTFWFRPLFFDAPGVLGLIISLENLFYLLLTFTLFKRGIIQYLLRSSALVKASLVLFIATSLALSGTLSNLGIISRQKTMVIYLLLIVIIGFMDYRQQQVADNADNAPGTGNTMFNKTVPQLLLAFLFFISST
ncbi:MAG TPA: hypothetical protein VL307_09245 [Chitinophagaceae bacterium]|nr:hypothetical protein [Chitinophagaceae bacterium]